MEINVHSYIEIKTRGHRHSLTSIVEVEAEDDVEKEMVDDGGLWSWIGQCISLTLGIIIRSQFQKIMFLCGKINCFSLFSLYC